MWMVHPHEYAKEILLLKFPVSMLDTGKCGD